MKPCKPMFHRWRVVEVYENRFVEQCQRCGKRKLIMGRPGY